tara:strand:- start:256 stop:372 length:117 start_codon:yes stop_codon:yes gene_type:complete
MKILKKKALNIIEVYVVLAACMMAGYLSYFIIIKNLIY